MSSANDGSFTSLRREGRDRKFKQGMDFERRSRERSDVDLKGGMSGPAQSGSRGARRQKRSEAARRRRRAGPVVRTLCFLPIERRVRVGSHATVAKQFETGDKLFPARLRGGVGWLMSKAARQCSHLCCTPIASR